jgi:hypothetical protein
MKGRQKAYEGLRSRVLVLVDESNVGSSVGAWLLDRADDVGTDLFVALQL